MKASISGNLGPGIGISTKSFRLLRVISFVTLILTGITVFIHRRNSVQFVSEMEFVRDNRNNLDQMDPRLIEYANIRYLTPPSTLPYNLKVSGNHKDDFSTWVANFFRNKKGGIFIEAGAYEGEAASHTLYLELGLEWTGLLVECNPMHVPSVKSKHRKAWIAEVCLTGSRTPDTVNFSNPLGWDASGTLNSGKNAQAQLPAAKTWTTFEVDTMPLYTLLAAIGWTEIDYFSFDIEGYELSVLRTFPFHLVTFKVLIIEVFFYKPEQKLELNELLGKNGYHFVQYFDNDYNQIYVHNSVKHLLEN